MREGGRWRFLSERLVRSLVVVLAAKGVEGALLTPQVGPRWSCLADSFVSPPAPTEANGGPLSERIAAGNPSSWNAESKMRITLLPSGSNTPSQRIKKRECASMTVSG